MAMQSVAVSAGYVYDQLLAAAQPILEFGKREDVPRLMSDFTSCMRV